MPEPVDHAAHLRTAGLNVNGVDLSPTMVRVAGRLHPEIEFTAGELTALPADDGSADGVVAWYSIIHLDPEAIDAVAREFARVLRPAGAALVAFQAGSGSRTLTRAYGHDVVLRAELHNPGDVARSFAAHGFEQVEQMVRPPRETEKQPQAVLLFRRGAGAAPAGRRPLTPAR
ncbi:class I SAM-dependent methyltransferase [Arthrobacter sp. 1P04PC]|uniref:class I SAM-dependent methyltransferase n=1 Tax=unclassified Arthrobacter TaxID=235627 RepID=UPI0039A24CC6